MNFQHIVSTDPLQPAAFNPNVFEHDVEFDILLEAFKFARSLVNFEPLKSVVAQEVNPGPMVNSDEEIKGESVYASNLESISHLVF